MFSSFPYYILLWCHWITWNMALHQHSVQRFIGHVLRLPAGFSRANLPKGKRVWKRAAILDTRGWLMPGFKRIRIISWAFITINHNFKLPNFNHVFLGRWLNHVESPWICVSIARACLCLFPYPIVYVQYYVRLNTYALTYSHILCTMMSACVSEIFLGGFIKEKRVWIWFVWFIQLIYKRQSQSHLQ